MVNNIKVLFVRQLKLEFIEKDLEILKKHYNVKIIDFVLTSKKLNLPILLLRMFYNVLWADVTFSWFADIHAYWAVRFAKIFGKKSIVVVGGYEVAKVSEIGYGLLLNPRSMNMVKYTLKNANIILTVDNGLKKDAIKNLSVIGKNIQTIHTGYDYKKFKPKGKKENLVLTVSFTNDWRRVRLKGIDIFIKSAKLLPNTKFVIIGIQSEILKKLRNIAPSNVEFINSLPQQKLIQYYQKSKVYCQLSMREGLPSALCEAMLCECVPVGTKNGGIPTVIGNTGFYVPYGDVKATVKTINVALQSNKGRKARERIKKKFPIIKRERKLNQIIDSFR